MNTEDLALYNSANSKVVEDLCAVLPGVCVTILSDSFIIEAIDCGDLSCLVIASQQSYVSGVLQFQTEKELEGLN